MKKSKYRKELEKEPFYSIKNRESGWETEMHHPLVEKGIAALFKELGHVKTIEFFQRLGVNKGDSVKEIESITERMSKEDILKGIKARKGKK